MRRVTSTERIIAILSCALSCQTARRAVQPEKVTRQTLGKVLLEQLGSDLTVGSAWIKLSRCLKLGGGGGVVA